MDEHWHHRPGARPAPSSACLAHWDLLVNLQVTGFTDGSTPAWSYWYRTEAPTLFWPVDNALLFWDETDDDLFWTTTQMEWLPWPGRLAVTRQVARSANSSSDSSPTPF
jgi:hypothetical protein